MEDVAQDIPEEDAQDAKKRLEREAAAELERELKKRSQVRAVTCFRLDWGSRRGLRC